MTFFTNLASVKEIYVQVGNNYTTIPVNNPYVNKTYNIPLLDGTTLSIKVTSDNTTYNNRTVWKYELEHATELIYDAMIVY